MKQLLDRLRAQDAESQLVLRKDLFPRVVATCVRLLKNPALAEEVAEDIWMDFLYRYVHKVDCAEAIPSYLRMMTVRRCVRLRDMTRRHLPNLELADPRDPEDSLIQKVDQERFYARVYTCMQTLSERERAALSMRFGNDMTLEEIGRASNFTKQYARELVQRGIDKIKLCMGIGK